MSGCTLNPSVALRALAWLFAAGLGFSAAAKAADVTVDDSPAGQMQVIDGFGTCIGKWGDREWFQKAYYDDLGCSIMRMDLTPNFKGPYSDLAYNSPWFSNPPPLKIDDAAAPGGPEHNFVRTYTGPDDYAREFGGHRAAIAVMTSDLSHNIGLFDFTKTAAQGAMARAGLARKDRLGDFKLYGSIWSPAPWLKIANGQKWENHTGFMPATGTPFPFIWGGNFAGGKLDTSGTPLAVFDDGSGPTSALTQFARCTAAYLKGFQDTYGVRFYALSIQNEINFPEFYHSCVYATASEYIAALKAVRKELDAQPDLKEIRIAGPEDLLGDDPYAMWQFGSGSPSTCKNLQYLEQIAQDPEASAALDFCAIHGYAQDGATAAGADSLTWRRWADGWKDSPAPGIPGDISGFRATGRKSWMTETSGEKAAWLAPAVGFPGDGAWSIALKMQQALTVGRESACLYWQFAEKDDETTVSCLTRRQNPLSEPKLIATRHFIQFIRPGAVAVKANVSQAEGVTASAYVHQKNGTLTLTMVNKNSASQPVSITVPEDFSGVQSFHLVTSCHGSLWQESTAVVSSGKFNFNVPGYGIVTAIGQK